MRALLDDVAVANHQDHVGVSDRGQAMRDNKARAALHQRIHGALNKLLGTGIDVGSCLVQNQRRTVGQNGAGDGHELALTLRQIGALFVNHKVVAAGERMDKVVAARGACGGLDLGIARIGSSVADVLADGAVKQPRILQHHGKLAAKCRAVPVAHVNALDAQRAAVNVVKALQQLDERGLAGAGGTDDGDGLAGLCLAAKVVDDGLVGRVAKLDMVKLHVAGALFGNLRVGLLLLLGRGQELKDALGGSGHRLHRVAYVAQLLHGLRKVANVLDKALDVAGRGIAGQRELRAHHDDAHVAHVAHQAHKRHHQARQELRAPATNKEAVVLTVELLDRGLGAVEHLNDILAGKVLLDNAVDGAQDLLLLAEVRLREVNHHGQDNRGCR